MTPLFRRSFAAAASAALLTFTMAGVIPSTAAQDAGSAKAKTSKTKAKAPSLEADPAPEPSARTGRKAPDPMRRVPTYFGSLGLTNEQKEEIYAIQGRYLPQIQELQAKIESLRERAMADCEDVLTSPQKKILAEARKTAADRRKSASKAKAEAAE